MKRKIRQNIGESFKWAILIAFLFSLLILLPTNTNPAYIDPDPPWALHDTATVLGVFLFFFILGIFTFSPSVKE